MKKNIMLFIIILCLGIIITYPAFPISHALDSYCTIYNGYSKTALWFLQNGRVITFAFYNLFELIKLPMHSLGYISALLTNVFMSLSVISLYDKFKSKIVFTNKLQKGFLLISIFLLFYNPLIISILLLDEAFVIALGIYFLTLSAIKCSVGGIKNYVLSGVFCLFGIFCYQGIASYLFVILLLLLFLSNNFNWKNFSIKMFTTTIFYIVSSILNLLLIKIVGLILNESITKIGNVNLIGNINKILKQLLPDSLKYYFGFLNVKFYYLLLSISFILLIIGIIMNKDKLKNIIVSLLLTISCVLIPFAPNLIMSSSNYTDARMNLTIVAIPICFVIIMFAIFKNKLGNLLLNVILIGYFIMTAYSIHQNMMIDLKRYKNDIKYINNIYEKIKYYENKKDIKIKKIYYKQDVNSAYYYDFGNANGANIRLMAVDWSFECAFPSYTDKRYKLEKMSDSKYKKYFNKLDFDEINDKEFVFDGDTLYLLIY